MGQAPSSTASYDVYLCAVLFFFFLKLKNKQKKVASTTQLNSQCGSRTVSGMHLILLSKDVVLILEEVVATMKSISC